MSEIIELKWNDKLAINEYVLQSDRWTNSHTHKKIWGEVARGDLEWAKRTAKHYDIPLPAPDEALKKGEK